MDRTILERKIEDLQKQFDLLNEEKSSYQKKASDIEAELFRLQGDFRTVNELLSNIKLDEFEQETDYIANDPATTITVKPKKEKVLDATTS